MPLCWYAGSVEAAAQAGIINGRNGYFFPNSMIIREEFAAMIMRALAKTGTSTSITAAGQERLLCPFKDV
ncbi:MAG TPA: S-layer homology domain-containing protein [Candidatus Aquicultor sp.]